MVKKMEQNQEEMHHVLSFSKTVLSFFHTAKFGVWDELKSTMGVAIWKIMSIVRGVEHWGVVLAEFHGQMMVICWKMK